MKRAILSFALTMLICLLSSGQAPPPKRPSVAARHDPCEQEKSKAWAEGYLQGSKQGSKDGWQRALDYFSTDVGHSPKPLGIELLVEEMEGSDSYRFAAAEVIRTQFSDSLKVEPKAELKLYITGNKFRDVNVRTLVVNVEAVVTHPFRVGEHVRSLTASLVLAHHGETLTGYSEERTTQVAREVVYKVLSEFLKEWSEAHEIRSP